LSDLRHFVHQPTGSLRRYVREILWIRSSTPRTQTLLPETAMTLVLRQSGGAALNHAPLPDSIISGLQQRVRLVAHGANSSLIVVRFTEVGASAVLRDRADLLYARTIPLEEALPRQAIQDVQNKLADAAEMSLQIPIVESFLKARIGVGTHLSTQVESAARLIRNSGGRMPIAAVARHVAMSQSALERQLRAVSGATPKMLARLARLQTVCRLWDSGLSLTEITFEAGYFDQPHLVRDFRLFTGVAPQAFFRGASPRNLPTFYK
jgi:AraC-like DNA-binding protein